MKESKIPSMAESDVAMDKVFQNVLVLARKTADTYQPVRREKAIEAISIAAQFYMEFRLK